MNRPTHRLFWFAALLAVVVGCATARGDGSTHATRMIAPEPLWFDAEVAAGPDTPHGFTVRLTAEMPTPGWTLTVETVDVDAERRRIVARITKQAPAGIVSQVITPTRVEIPVGAVEPGVWLLELWTRRDPGADHRLEHAQVLIAS